MSQDKSPSSSSFDRSFVLPQVGDNPSTERQGTTPGSFANRGRVGTAWTYSSPDTPGMPQPSDVTAMEFARELDREAKTQLEEARIGRVSAEAKRVALREPHLTPEQIRAAVEEALRLYPAERVFLNPDCGFGTFSNRPMNTLEIASAKVANITAAARDLRGRS